MNPLLAAAVHALDLDEAPRRLTPDHPTGWRTARWKIKTATGGRVARAHHEAHAVAVLHDEGLYAARGTHGHVGEGVWTAVQWRPGTTVWDLCAPTREGARPTAGFEELLLGAAHAAFASLARLHAAGWCHGDVQPANIVVTPEGDVEFIDLDFAHHTVLLPLPYPYRRGMDHVTAPETAEHLTDTAADAHVELTDAAEVYSLGAALRWAWTGRNPSTTRGMGPGVSALDIMGDIATGRHRVPLEDVAPWRFPEFETLVEDAMAHTPPRRRRPSLTP